MVSTYIVVLVNKITGTVVLKLFAPVLQSLLKQEIEQLKYMVDHHPDVSKYAREALDLKAEIKRMKEDSSGGKDLSKELAMTHKYTLQLEQQLRHFLVKGKCILYVYCIIWYVSSGIIIMSSSCTDGGSSPPLTKRGSTQNVLELENLKARCKQLVSELDKARKALQTEREEFHLKESRLEANLTAAKKANLELEVQYECLIVHIVHVQLV